MKNEPLWLSPEEIEKKEQIVILPETRRQIQSQHIITDNVFWAVWVGVIPAPFIDVVFITAVQLKMISELSLEYNVKFSKNRVKAIIASLLAGVTTQALVKSNLLGMIPGLGTLSGRVSMTVFAGATTYAVGQIFVRHFESGGTLLNFDLVKSKNDFTNLYQEGEKVVMHAAQ